MPSLTRTLVDNDGTGNETVGSRIALSVATIAVNMLALISFDLIGLLTPR